MKLIIQIPCYNEQETLPATLTDLPRQVEGFDEVEWLIIDDGSSDETRRIAQENGVNHIVGFSKNQGLAKAFLFGLESCVKRGADVIVNTDADNQYRAEDIVKLSRPVLIGEADIVVGERPIGKIRHFSPVKRALQKIGSWVVRKVSHTSIPDAPSGFRAIGREAAIKLNVFNEYTYTLETIIQAGMKDMSICSVPVDVNEQLRESRLVKSIPNYVSRSIGTILRIFVVYRPFKFFMTIGTILFSVGFLLGLRYLYFILISEGEGHVQSVILAAVLMIIGFQTILIAFIADILAVNRKLLEEIQFRLRKQDYASDEKSAGLDTS